MITLARGRGPGLETLIREEVESKLDDPTADDVYRQVVERIERPLLETALQHTQGNQIQAAALLGINRNTLRKKINDLSIRIPGRGRDE